ncbi:hypothetical protein [Fictibacillus sp. 18YEL24]|uniref:hypothetical protein n=1 Tax=Fictibacillus sp. 18YEL24 TaxID=2745875 RepID=UPI0018CF7749|nr:hypothetical protein [Fictibacillus sp. 18YEL24]MBH0169591.1 hypothetical protein [Fictibacillus sp. 18YEL24]
MIASYSFSATIGDMKVVTGGERTFLGGTEGVGGETLYCIGETEPFTSERVRNIKTHTVNIRPYQ